MVSRASLSFIMLACVGIDAYAWDNDGDYSAIIIRDRLWRIKHNTGQVSICFTKDSSPNCYPWSKKLGDDEYRLVPASENIGLSRAVVINIRTGQIKVCDAFDLKAGPTCGPWSDP